MVKFALLVARHALLLRRGCVESPMAGAEPSTSLRACPILASVWCGIPLIVKESDELSICRLFRCAGRFWHSDQSWPARAREQEQRVADLSSHPPASRRSICAWWPDEGSALEMALFPMVIDRIRRGPSSSRCNRNLQRLCDRCQLPSS